MKSLKEDINFKLLSVLKEHTFSNPLCQDLLNSIYYNKITKYVDNKCYFIHDKEKVCSTINGFYVSKNGDVLCYLYHNKTYNFIELKDVYIE
ncbi:hypothetical protein DIDNDMLP_00386 [Klebsiella phage KP13-7]|uniref:Uncharacterized protein n=1 Tax=Klebsiella phage vB_KleM_RaK2 TaxID=1147094 RepID=H6X4T1_9CAUD|nr:hypothetical protein F403_gp061 [Klebsiella phage vB_KleM_RaK2]AFA44747.1 hypothetical protein RaK2_00474 [Klebsiella phage vB_KleM_RaK2]UYL05371.1 hypothetical protein DIDNDMLP_00386 [Klebsiella phage KP13-7]